MRYQHVPKVLTLWVALALLIPTPRAFSQMGQHESRDRARPEQERIEQPERAERPERAEGVERAERPGRIDRPERVEKVEVYRDGKIFAVPVALAD